MSLSVHLENFKNKEYLICTYHLILQERKRGCTMNWFMQLRRINITLSTIQTTLSVTSTKALSSSTSDTKKKANDTPFRSEKAKRYYTFYIHSFLNKNAHVIIADSMPSFHKFFLCIHSCIFYSRTPVTYIFDNILLCTCTNKATLLLLENVHNSLKRKAFTSPVRSRIIITTKLFLFFLSQLPLSHNILRILFCDVM